MKIRMTQTAPGSVDGIRVQSYEAGREYDLSESAGARDLAAAFVGAGLAVDLFADATPATKFAAETAAHSDDTDAGEQIDGQGLAPVRAKPGRKPRNK